MSLELAPGWQMDLDHGPDWIFVRLLPPDDLISHHAEVAMPIWRLLEQEFTYRLVLELDHLPLLSSQFSQASLACRRMFRGTLGSSI